MTTTPETNSSYKDKVEADKRSILRKALNVNFNVSRRIVKTGPIKVPQPDQESDEELNLILGRDDIDDSEEIFNTVLKKVEEECAREKEFKKKYPLFKTQDYLQPSPKQRRKRKSKAFDNCLNMMNTFKKILLESKAPEKNVPTISTLSTEENKAKSSSRTSLNTEKNKARSLIKTSIIKKNPAPTYKIYPQWKTTETYTPIFPMSSNPRWTQQKYSSKLAKLYTPKHIYNWMNTGNNTDMTVPSSCRSIRTDAATCNSRIDNGSLSSPIRSPIDSSTPMRSTIVRFKPSPPEQIPYSSYENSSIPSNYNLEEKIEEKEMSDNDSETSNYYSEKYEFYTPNVKEYPKQYQGYTQKYEEYPKKYQEYKEYKEYEELNFHTNDDSNETNAEVSHSTIKKPFSIEDFIKNFKYNDRCSNMEIKYSMKL